MQNAAAEINAHLISNKNEKGNLDVANMSHNIRFQTTRATSAICRLDLTNGNFK